MADQMNQNKAAELKQSGPDGSCKLEEKRKPKNGRKLEEGHNIEEGRKLKEGRKTNDNRKTKECVLEQLEQHRGTSISGEMLADTLGISRSAIWKAISELRKEGYVIEAITNKGYCLTADNDRLSPQGMLPYLRRPEDVDRIHVFETVTTTNDVLKKMALEGAKEGTIVLAEQQTKGKGRRGRSFFSPPRSGVYMSMLLKPAVDLTQSVLITTAASVAVCRAIEKVTGISAQIKWVNDVYWNNKKICGILTEAVTDFESGQIQHIILGIGVNCTSDPNLPEPLISVVGALDVDGLSRNQLAAEIYNEALAINQSLDSREFIPEYKRRSLVFGKKIRIYQAGAAPTPGDQSDSNGEFKSAVVTDIGSSGELIVRYDDGAVESLNTGEITVRLSE